MKIHTANCCCGACNITVQEQPEMISVCHCNNCKKRTGSAFGISTYFEKENVTQISGQFHCYRLHHKTQNHDQQRYFCKNCGTTLYWKISTLPNLIGIAGGCFEDPDFYKPKHSVSHSQKLPWVSLPESWDCHH
ncbi:hypothetical protein P886_0851 [Alteromonadaceae bacterium 2753L.S.0a.02]|nr:hypothetical protein P886_0851 [Alteromonadaceae bacterium 2753L.S.0a.02]